MAVAVSLFNHKGEKVGETALPKFLFDRKVSPALVHQVVVAQRANQRKPIAHTKDRGEVRGGGRKPWRQKGTGRARHGSIRSPQWRGGGVVFGPRKNRNFSERLNKKMTRSALAMVLTDRANENRVILIDSFEPVSAKTKLFATMVNTLPIKSKKTLLLLGKGEKGIARAASNIRTIFPYKADSVQALSVATYPFMLMSKDGLDELASVFKSK